MDSEVHDLVSVPRSLLKEVLADGCCPLHLRLQLSRFLVGEVLLEEPLLESLAPKGFLEELAEAAESGDDDIGAREDDSGWVDATKIVEEDADVVAEAAAAASAETVDVLATLHPFCLAGVAAYLPLAEVLTVRACSREPLQWAMQREVHEYGTSRKVHDRIRTRLWMRRIADLTAGTKDESVFETQMRSLADEALRSRMEDEMQQALVHMEEQIQSFQAEVDRRLEEQERHVRRMVEERVQQELDAVLVSEVAKVQHMVEERVRERVSAIFRREVRETVRELQDKLDSLVHENQTLSDAFAEANLRAKSFFWACNPHPLRTAFMAGVGFNPYSAHSLKRRMIVACPWQAACPSRAFTEHR